VAAKPLSVGLTAFEIGHGDFGFFFHSVKSLAAILSEKRCDKEDG
jgi:hypothetical protein